MKKSSNSLTIEMLDQIFSPKQNGQRPSQTGKTQNLDQISFFSDFRSLFEKRKK